MNELMRRMLETRGIYMAPATADGEAGGGGAAGGNNDAGDSGNAGDSTGDQASDSPNGNGDRGNADDAGAGDADAAGDKPAASSNKPTDREAQLLKETMKWKDKFRTLEQTIAEIQSQLGDVDPATARKLVDEAKERERTDLEKKGEYDRIVQQMRTENTKLVDQKTAELTQTQTALQAATQQIEGLTVGAEFRKSEFITKNSALPPTIAQKEFGAFFEFQDGVLVPYDKPRGAAERTVMVDANGTPKSFEQAIAELHMSHPDSKSLIRTTMKPGAGSKSKADLSVSENKSTKLSGLAKIEQGLSNFSKPNQ
jgi:hypothetical protein